MNRTDWPLRIAIAACMGLTLLMVLLQGVLKGMQAILLVFQVLFGLATLVLVVMLLIGLLKPKPPQTP